MLKIFNEVKLDESSKVAQRKVKSFSENKKVSSPLHCLKEIVKQPKLNHIYQDTKKMMLNLIKNDEWKHNGYFPKIRKNIIQNEVTDDWIS